MQKNRRLQDEYRFPGFRPQATIKGIFGDPHARVVVLKRRQKKQCADVVEEPKEVFTTARFEPSGICRVVRRGSIWKWKFGGFCVEGAGR